jgi:hypothetical protein
MKANQIPDGIGWAIHGRMSYLERKGMASSDAQAMAITEFARRFEGEQDVNEIILLCMLLDVEADLTRAVRYRSDSSRAA